MRLYLRFVNPVVAAAVLVLCVYASTVEDGSFMPGAALQGGIPTYFVAKGIFCSSALFLLGRVLLGIIALSDGKRGDLGSGRD